MKQVTWAYRQSAIDEWSPPEREGEPSPLVQKMVMYVLNSFAGNQCDCFPSIKTLATRSCMNESTVKRALAAMEKTGVITATNRCRPNGGCTSNTYLIVYEKLCESKIVDSGDEACQEQCSGSDARAYSAPPQGVQRPPPGRTAPPFLTIQYNHPMNSKDSHAQKTGVAGGQDEVADRRIKPPEQEIPASLDTPEFRVAWEAWKKYRRETNHKLVPSTVSRQFTLLEKLGVPRAILAIDHSISQGYRGIYEPRGAPRVTETPVFKFIPRSERVANASRKCL